VAAEALNASSSMSAGAELGMGHYLAVTIEMMLEQ
jgi:hypothetical protein